MVGWDVVPQPLVPLVVLAKSTFVALITRSHGQRRPEDRVN
jgi:hypothetical protein